MKRHFEWLACLLYAFLLFVGAALPGWLIFYNLLKPAVFQTMMEAMTDVRLENISLEEARRRVHFPICLPTWLPQSLEGPQISFHAEWGAPWVTDVTFSYYRQNQPILEIFQAYRPWEWRKGFTSWRVEDDAGYIAFSLLKWQVGYEEARQLESEAILLKVIENNGIRRRVYELIKPVEYHAFWIDWWSAQPFSSPPGERGEYGVYYRISSRLSLSETLQVGMELKECLPPLLTPTPDH